MTTVAQRTKNAETLAEMTRRFNQRDFEAAVERLTDDFTYTDIAEGTTVRGPREVVDWLQGFLRSFSDVQAVDPTYIDAGDTIIECYSMQGTNDGPFGEYPATGERVYVPVCEIWRFNDQGKATSAEMYYDRLSLLDQLGDLQQLPTDREV